MIEVIKVLICSIILELVFVKAGEIILKEKSQLTKGKKIIVYTINAIFMSVNHLLLTNLTKVIFVFIDYFVLAKIMYKKEVSKSVVLVTLYYITLMISESITVLILTLIFNLFSLGKVEDVINTIYVTIIITTVIIIFVKTLKKQYTSILESSQNKNILVLGILGVLIILCIGSIFYRRQIVGWELNSAYLLDTITMIIIGIIGVFVIRQRINYERIKNQYKDLAKYSEISATLLEEYSMLNHEHKNQLIIIDGMITDKNKELGEYVKSLIEKKDKVKFKWIKELNNISFQGLKSFMNYKILEMKQEKLKVNVMISQDCKKYNLEKLIEQDKDKIYSIMGVFLDNAKEAATNSKKKEVIINAYVMEKEMYIEIANTYEGKINLEKINNYGYTSKGTGRGTGLYMIQNIIKESKKFKTTTQLRDQFFIQTLIIKI